MSDSNPSNDILDQFLGPIRHALDEQGLDERFLAKLLKEETEATVEKPFLSRKKIIYSKPLPAWEIKQRARMDAHKLRGDYPVEEHRITGDMITSRSPEEIEVLREAAKRVIEELMAKRLP